MKIDREKQEEAADGLVNLGVDSQSSFFARVRKRLDEQDIQLPEVTVEYNHLTYTTEASSASQSIPGLGNVVLRILKSCAHRERQKESLHILNDISGQVQPGRFTLLLGPPSCGKSTLLRLLAGRVPQGTKGEITWNGHTVNEFCAPRTTVLVAQVDTHIPMLTARETAAFTYDVQNSSDGAHFKVGAALAKGHETDSGLVKGDASPSKLAETLKESLADGNAISDATLDELAALMLDGTGRPDLFLRMFGLANCADTFVGNAMLRGISGGEHKRLSTVEMLMSHQRVLVLDEISTGLDSATLFNVIRWLRAMNHHLSTTTVISLLQPPPETFALFDDLMLMTEGRIVYHGPLQGAVPFFDALGFQLPPRKDVPSFLQEVLTVQGQVTYSTPELKAKCRLPPGIDPTDEEAMAELELLVSLQEMVETLPRSQEGAAYAAGLAKRVPKSMAGLVPVEHSFPLGALASLQLVLRRQRQLFVRDKSLVKARIAQCVIMGLIIGSLFYGLEVNVRDGRTFLGAIFISVMFVGFGGMPQLAVVLQNRNIWFKHRAANMYGASAYAWSMSLVQVPMSCLEAFIFSLPIYFLIGFSLDSAQYFFIFYAVLVLASLSITSIFRLIGCLFRDLALANAAAGFTLLMLIVNSGFIIVHNGIPPWVICFYWISPFAYAVRALSINEMTSPRWQPENTYNSQPIGAIVLDEFDIYHNRVWIWIAMAYMAAVFVLATQLAAVGLHFLHPPSKAAVVHSKAELKASRIAARKAKLAAEEFLSKTSAAQQASGQADAIAEEGAAKRPSHVSSQGLAVARTLVFSPISVVWRHLSYYVSVPKGLTGPAAANIMAEDCGDSALVGKKRLLNDLTGYARPGVLTALMGGSGAGKTTLMDVLAGRKTQGVITGELLVNGHPKEQATWSRVVGYVEQTDVHSGGLTVEESLHFSAGLRLSDDVSAEQREAYVQEVLIVTELLDIRGCMVGNPGETGLSVEQRRRLSIGVELVANPSVVFMDEPTSGLDARSAGAVMAAVKNVAGNGRTVMVTIHQPSIEIFEAFDALVLLGMGGVPIFFGSLGSHSSRLVDYFEAIPGVPKLPPDYNPATWMLEVSGGAAKMYVDSVQADFHGLYLQSDLARSATETVDLIAQSDKKSHEQLTMASLYATTRTQQNKQLLWKYCLLYWRNPGYSLGRIVTSTITALLFGLTFWGQGSLPPPGHITIANVQNILGSVYSGLSFMGMTNLIMGIPQFYAERQVSYRERASSMYAVLPLAIATGVAEVPYLLVQALIFAPIVYFMIDFKHDFEAFAIYLIIFWESISLYTFMGQLFTYLAASPILATLLGSLNHLLWNIFNGFLVPNPQIAPGWIWLNYISATTWVIYGLGASQLGNVEDKIIVHGIPEYAQCSESNLSGCPTVSWFVEYYFGYKYSMRWWCVLILLAFIVLFRVSAMIVLKVVNHQHR